MPRKKRKGEDGPPGSPAWMTTYGDMMTLLLVFFVLLYSFSVMDIEKFQGFISALQSQLGVLDGGKTISEATNVSRGSAGVKFNPDNANFQRAMGQISQYINQEGLQDRVRMQINERGLVITLTGQILYDIGQAGIKPGGKIVLDKLAETVSELNNDIVVEGHTDNWPISNEEFPSNWELSTSRATNIIKYFIDTQQINPTRLSAAGYSEYRPVASNDTVENRSKNRRVEIVVLRQ